MSKRQEHSFQFKATQIAVAAKAEAEYHEQRIAYWQAEFEKAYARVEATIGAKIERQQVTGGWQSIITVNHGDPAAALRLSQSERKIQDHQKAAERLRSDQQLYETQGERAYDLDTDDVHHYRLGGGPRDD
jgi:hypothetical protein